MSKQIICSYNQASVGRPKITRPRPVLEKFEDHSSSSPAYNFIIICSMNDLFRQPFLKFENQELKVRLIWIAFRIKRVLKER